MTEDEEVNRCQVMILKAKLRSSEFILKAMKSHTHTKGFELRSQGFKCVRLLQLQWAKVDDGKARLEAGITT